MSPHPPQPEQLELSIIESDSVDKTSELHQSFFSIAMKNRVDKDGLFQQMPPQLSVPLEAGEQTGIAVKIGQRALDGQALGKVSRKLWDRKGQRPIRRSECTELQR